MEIVPQLGQKVRELILSEQFQPVIEQALRSSQDFASATAFLAINVVNKIDEKYNLEDDELWDDDGLVVYVLDILFAYAAALGLPGVDQSQADKALDIVQQEVMGGNPGEESSSQGDGMEAQNQGAAPQGRPLMAG